VQNWLEREPGPASVAIVWLPMLPGDDAAAALSMTTSFHDKRVVQFWDPGRLSGKQWSIDFQVEVARAALDSLPADHPYRTIVERWVADPASVPMWDVAYFYPPDVRWKDKIPMPSAWTKQMGFWGPPGNNISGGVADTTDTATGSDSLPSPESGAPHATGRFWNHTSPTHAMESDWGLEFASGMERVMRAPGER
jgi:hypothetical protein